MHLYEYEFYLYNRMDDDRDIGYCPAEAFRNPVNERAHTGFVFLSHVQRAVHCASRADTPLRRAIDAFDDIPF